MPAPQPMALELSCEPAGTFEAMALTGVAKYAPAIDAWAAEPQGYALREPSSLALILIGVATLAAYRGVVGALGGGKSQRRAEETLIRPRRRAA